MKRKLIAELENPQANVSKKSKFDMGVKRAPAQTPLSSTSDPDPPGLAGGASQELRPASIDEMRIFFSGLDRKL